MTVEASIVMSVVILSLASLIRYAYTVHDTVTGGMILEETIERVRNNVDKKKTPDMFEAEGTRMGNPRLFLGEYMTEDSIQEYRIVTVLKADRNLFPFQQKLPDVAAVQEYLKAAKIGRAHV